MQVTHPRIIGELDRDLRPQAAGPPALREQVGDGARPKGLAGDGGLDRGAQLLGAIRIEQAQEASRVLPQILAAPREHVEDRVGLRHGSAQPIPPGEVPRLALGGGERREVRRVLDRHAGRVGARVAGDLVRAVEQAHRVGTGHQGERLADEGVRD